MGSTRNHAILATIAFLVAAPLCDGAVVSKDEFLAQYEPAVAKLKHRYGALEVSGSVTKINWPMNTGSESSKVVVYAAGDRMRTDVIKRVSAGRDDQEVVAAVVAPEASFTVSKAAGASAYVLTNLIKDQRVAEHAQRLNQFLRFAPYKDRIGWDIIEKIKSPGLTLTAIDNDERDGEPLVKVSYHDKMTFNNRPTDYVGWWLFAKNKSWALRGSFRQKPDDDSLLVWSNIEYEGEAGDVPLVKFAEYWQEEAGKRSKVQRFEVTSLKPAAPADDVFKLSAFGIRDVAEGRETNSWLYLITGGILLIAVAIVLVRLLAARRMRT